MERLKLLRKEKGLSMKEFGSMFGLAECTISLYEKGKRQPDTDTILRFADFFNVSVDYLLGRDERATEPTGETAELLALMQELTEEELQQLSSFADFIISQRK